MNKRFLNILTVIISLAGLLSCMTSTPVEEDAHAYATSPFVQNPAPEKLYAVVDENLTEDQKLAIASLQGLMAKTETGLFRVTNEASEKWLGILEKIYDIEIDWSLKNDFPGILKRFSPEIDGYILCNTYDLEIEYQLEESLSVALTLAGPLNSIVLTEENRSAAEKAGLVQVYDAREKKLVDIIEKYDSSLNNRQLIYRSFQRARTFLTDYAVSGNMINYYDSLYNEAAQKIFNRMEPNSTLLGWGESEDGLVESASSRSVMVHPADWANNLSVLSNIPASSTQKENGGSAPEEEKVHTVCFVMSDGDNIQWTINDFATSDRWYGSDYRGKLKLGWTISPALSELAPPVLEYYYANASNSGTGRDYFIAGPSGVGYIFPEKYPHIDSYTALLDDYMEKADLSIVNILAGSRLKDDYLHNFMSEEHIDALFLYYYSNYSGGGGKISWVNDKPVITGRANLWTGFNTPESLAARLNELSTDPSSEIGYSLIPVHVWTMSVEDVYRCVSLLDENVQVVAPDEFVDLIRDNVKR